MMDLLTKAEMREITILNHLYEESKWWTVQELATKIDSGVATVYNAIAHINHVALAENQAVYIETQKTKGVFLTIDAAYSIHEIEGHYIKNSLRFKILDKIIQESDLTIQSLANDLFISSSTIYRKILELNEILELSHLTINLKTLILTGDEVVIRHLMFTMYRSMEEAVNWPFASVSKDVIDYRIETYFNDFGLIAGSTGYSKLAFRLGIMFSRHQKKQFITDFPHHALVDPFKRQLLDSYREVLAPIVPGDCLDNEINDITTFNLFTLVCETHSEVAQQSNDYHQEHNTLSYQAYSTFFEAFNQQYPNILEKDDLETQYDFIFVFNYFYIYKEVYFDVPIIINYALNVFERNTPSLYHKLEVILEELKNLPNNQTNMISYYYVFLQVYMTLARRVDLQSLEKLISVKITCSFSKSSELTLKRDLIKKSSQPIVVFTRDDVTDETGPYDLVISNFPLSESEKKDAKHIYRWVFPPTARDWSTVLDLLATIK